MTTTTSRGDDRCPPSLGWCGMQLFPSPNRDMIMTTTSIDLKDKPHHSLIWCWMEPFLNQWRTIDKIALLLLGVCVV